MLSFSSMRKTAGPMGSSWTVNWYPLAGRCPWTKAQPYADEVILFSYEVRITPILKSKASFLVITTPNKRILRTRFYWAFRKLLYKHCLKPVKLRSNSSACAIVVTRPHKNTALSHANLNSPVTTIIYRKIPIISPPPPPFINPPFHQEL